MVIMRQRSPSTLSFHPDPESGMDDLDVLLLRRIESYPGISVAELTRSMRFYNKDDPTEEVNPNYYTILYRIDSLEHNSLLVTRRKATEKGMERQCFRR
jgi:hypothetical protein